VRKKNNFSVLFGGKSIWAVAGIKRSETLMKEQKLLQPELKIM
jgi:hypothetical protein